MSGLKSSRNNGAEQAMQKGRVTGRRGCRQPHVKFISILSLTGLRLANSTRHTLPRLPCYQSDRPSPGCTSHAWICQQPPSLLPHQIPAPNTKLLLPSLPSNKLGWKGSGLAKKQHKEASKPPSSPFERGVPPAATHQEQGACRRQLAPVQGLPPPAPSYN